jgi:hypothetical protein
MIGMVLVLTIAQWLVRITGILLLILGLLIWTEGAFNLITIHTYLGILMVLSLWVLAAVSTRAGVPVGLAAGVALGGLVVLVFGMVQRSLLPDPSVHWIVQIVHLLIGMLAVASGEVIGGRVKRARMATATS